MFPCRLSSNESQAGPPQPAAQANGFAPDSSQSQSNSVSARFLTLQAYIADLEAEKFELQRGLQKQQATMAALADDQLANDERFQSLKSEHSQLESDVQQYAQALSAKVRRVLSQSLSARVCCGLSVLQSGVNEKYCAECATVRCGAELMY